jgi:hypothetical protein
MSDGEFADFLGACRGELQVKQTGIAECLGRSPYAYDIDQGLLTLGSEAHSIVVIGTYCVLRRTWLWGWANDSYSDAARERSASLKGLRVSPVTSKCTTCGHFKVHHLELAVFRGFCGGWQAGMGRFSGW